MALKAITVVSLFFMLLTSITAPIAHADSSDFFSGISGNRQLDLENLQRIEKDPAVQQYMANNHFIRIIGILDTGKRYRGAIKDYLVKFQDDQGMFDITELSVKQGQVKFEDEDLTEELVQCHQEVARLQQGWESQVPSLFTRNGAAPQAPRYVPQLMTVPSFVKPAQ